MLFARKTHLYIFTAAVFTSIDPREAQAKVVATDFINGFETGIFVRDDENAFYDYSCEKPKGDSTI